MIRAGPIVAVALVLLLACAVAAQVAAQESKDSDGAAKDKALWWATFSMYSASLVLVILQETHKQPCDVPGCDRARRDAYVWGSAATTVAAVSLDLWRIKRGNQSIVFGVPARRNVNSVASVGYKLTW